MCDAQVKVPYLDKSQQKATLQWLHHLSFSLALLLQDMPVDIVFIIFPNQRLSSYFQSKGANTKIHFFQIIFLTLSRFIILWLLVHMDTVECPLVCLSRRSWVHHDIISICISHHFDNRGLKSTVVQMNPNNDWCFLLFTSFSLICLHWLVWWGTPSVTSTHCLQYTRFVERLKYKEWAWWQTENCL